MYSGKSSRLYVLHEAHLSASPGIQAFRLASLLHYWNSKRNTTRMSHLQVIVEPVVLCATGQVSQGEEGRGGHKALLKTGGEEVKAM